MAVYYINGTSNSGATFGQSGYFYPLYLTASEANSAIRSDGTIGGTSHAHTFEEAPNITFYMPAESGEFFHAQASAPIGNYSGEVYISYSSPIAEADVEEIGTGVLASDTFNSWRKKTNDVARESISNKSLIGSVDTRLTRLLSVTGGENNIMSLTSSDNITGEKEFEGIVKFSGADEQANAIQIGLNGKLYVESNKFFFDKDIDLHAAGAEIKASSLNIPQGGTTNYSGNAYKWPIVGPSAGQFLKSDSNNNLEWSAVTAGDLASEVEAFFVEDPFPIGSIMQHSGSNAPSKYLFCDGAAVSRTTYSELFAVISTTYGAGDGSTTFNLPNLKGRVPVGLGQNTDANGVVAEFQSLGNTSYVDSPGVNSVTRNGEYKHTLTVDEMPSHRHQLFDDEGHKYFAVNDDNRGTDSSAANNNTLGSDAFSIQEVGTAQTVFPDAGISQTTYTGGLGTNAAGDNQVTARTDIAHNIVQPFIVLNYIIKAKGSAIVEQHVKAENGVLINDSNTTTNLLRSATDSSAKGSSNNPNTFSLNVDSDNFEFDGDVATGTGTGKLKLVADMFIPNIVQSVSNKTMKSSQDLPGISTATLTSALWPSHLLKDVTTSRTWSNINKYPLYASITPRRENSMFKISVNAFGSVQGDDSCGITVSYNTGSYAHGSVPTGLVETVIGDSQGLSHHKGVTFHLPQSADAYTDSGSWNGLWSPSISAGTTINFFLSLVGLNDGDDQMSFNHPFTTPNSTHTGGVFPTNIMVEEIYTQ